MIKTIKLGLLCLLFFSKAFSQVPFDWIQSISGKALQSNNGAFSNALAIDMEDNVVSFLTSVDTTYLNGTMVICGPTPEPLILKHTKEGSLLWSKKLNTPVSDICTDQDNNIYLVGSFNDSIEIDGIKTYSNGYRDAYIAKLSPGGVCLWIRNGGTKNQNDYGYGVIADIHGNVFLTGMFAETDSAYFGSEYVISNGGEDFYLAKYDAASGNEIWVRSGGSPSPGTAQDEGDAVGVDSFGNVYVWGKHLYNAEFEGTVITTGSVLSDNLFLAKYSPSGGLDWIRQVYGVGSYKAKDIAVDNAGNSYVTGLFNRDANFDGSTVLSAGGNTFQPDFFVAKYDFNGNLAWVRQMGDMSGTLSLDFASSVALDKCNQQIYISGRIAPFEDSLTILGDTITAPISSYIINYDENGNRNWLLTSTDAINGLAVDENSNFYLAGSYTDTLIINDNELISTGASDAFVAKMKFNANINFPLSDTIFCNLENASINIGNPMESGLEYTWEPAINLSDSSSSDPLATIDTTTTFYVNIEGENCASYEDSLTIYIAPPLVGGACCDTVVKKGTEVTSIAEGGASYQWQAAEGEILSNEQEVSLVVDDVTKLFVNIVDSNSCEHLDSVLIDIILPDMALFVPNAFSPDQRGENKQFVTIVEGYEDYHLAIYDRLGKLVFESFDQTNKWIGADNQGIKVGEGVYQYQLKVVDNKNELIYQKGNITLLR